MRRPPLIGVGVPPPPSAGGPQCLWRPVTARLTFDGSGSGGSVLRPMTVHLREGRGRPVAVGAAAALKTAAVDPPG
jgi:hypothetical protein